ncbi:MAG: hypothetical protein JO145_14580 [Acidobacteriaceae bacterium]|nr:hypothetical protein [Acidobacteriaceae bacterium]MBV9764180.1 hypothetical protein [Acidobacteriaceae bacterium]
MFAQQLVLGFPAIFQTYAQYLHVVPRLLALLTNAFPVSWAPLLYAIEAFVIAALCCWAFMLEEFRPVLQSDALRVILCLLSAIVFPAQEMVGVISDLQWFLTTVAVPLILVPAKPRPKTIRFLLLLLGLLIALSAPLTIVLVPVIAIYGVRERSITDFRVGILAGTLIQWAVIAAHWTSRAGSLSGFAAVNGAVFATLVAFTNQIAMYCLLGKRVVDRVWHETYKGVSLVLLLTLSCSQLWLYVRGGRQYREKVRLILWLLFSSLLLAILRGTEPAYTEMSAVQLWGAHRYFFMGCWCFAFLFLTTIEDRTPGWPESKRCALAVVPFLLGAIFNFTLAPHAITNWQQYVPEIQAWQTDKSASRAHVEVVIPISPPGWTVHLPALQPASQQK